MRIGAAAAIATLTAAAACASGPASKTTAGAGAAASSSGGSTPINPSLLDPTEVARVAKWLSDPTSGLESYAYTNIDMYFPVGPKRDRLVDAIVGACAAFAPRLPNWQMYCEALETSEIVSESSYVPGSPTPGPPSSPSVNYDSYATMDGHDDPTVGLLQIRFSSTVQDYENDGPRPVLASLGCSWPSGLSGQSATFWNTQGGTATYLAFMEDPACNIPLSAWYVWMNATGNGGPSPVYASDYCGGNGVAGTIVDGLLSFLEGPGFPRPADPTNAYVTGIKARFAKLLGGLPSPDPFGVTLSPSVSQLCR